MIREVVTKTGAAAITSDRWHVVHSHFVAGKRKYPFVRTVLSEHDDRAACGRAARTLRATLAEEAGAIPVLEQDEVFVRKPNFKSLKNASCQKTKPRPA